MATGRDAARAKRLLDALRELEVRAVPFAVDGEPDLEVVRRGVALARRERCDLVIGFGGGSALDAGKAIAAMLTNDGDVLDYLEVIGGGKPLARSSAPLLAIPTTAGTGAEVTRNAVLASSEHRVKVSLRSPLMLPKVALVDPELTWDLPPALTASTGLDALTQLIEPYVSGRANPMTDGLCVEGIGRAARSLRAAFENGRNAVAREDMALASLFGGLALANAGTGSGAWSGRRDWRHVWRAPRRDLRGAAATGDGGQPAGLRSRDSASPALPRYEEVARQLTGRTAPAERWRRMGGPVGPYLQIPNSARYGLTARARRRSGAKAEQRQQHEGEPDCFNARGAGRRGRGDLARGLPPAHLGWAGRATLRPMAGILKGW